MITTSKRTLSPIAQSSSSFNTTNWNSATTCPLMMRSVDLLPPELLQLVLTSLRGCDLKSLRLTCVSLSRLVQLRLGRVFLSAHPRDIQVLNDVTNHPQYREHVTELIFDDASFPSSWLSSEELEYNDDVQRYDTPPRSEAPLWYERMYDENCEDLEKIKNTFIRTPENTRISTEYESRISVGESYSYYLKLVERQNKAIADRDDIKALKHALQRFPNLRRVTVTPAAHGIPLRPLYETPMIRELPYGFIYPLPRSWPLREDHTGASYVPLPWNDEEIETTQAKRRWRGLRLVLETLSQHPHRITEFIAEVNMLPTGLPCRMFDNQHHNPDCDNLVSLLGRPGFSRLDLALDVGDQDYDEWPFFRSGLLRDALSKAKDLRHFSLSTGATVPHTTLQPSQHLSHGLEHFFPLKSLIPVEQWEQLRHFGLTGFIVKRPDLIEFLSILPPTLRSANLSLLHFMDLDGSSWREFLPDLRDKLDWNQRPAIERPRITVYMNAGNNLEEGYVDISREVEDFVYRHGRNPFEKTEHCGSQVFRGSIVGIERFPFKPDEDLPFLHTEHLVDLGLKEPNDFYLRGIRFDKPLTPEQRAHYNEFDLRRGRGQEPVQASNETTAP